jgi:hypothetical protein
MTPLIVIPVLDEAATIGAVVQAARAHGRVLVVDDGSRDGSGDVAAAAGAEVLRHPRRLGKAQALLTGLAAARRRGATSIVTLDGDGQHAATDIPALLEAARSSDRTVIVGSRWRDAGGLPSARGTAVRMASFFTSWVTGLPIPDSQCGLRVYPLKLFDEIQSRRGGFVFETEVLLEAASHGWSVEPVPVTVRPRLGARSRFRPARDGCAVASFLAGRVIARWGREVGHLVREALAVFAPERLAVRHAYILEVSAPYRDSPARWAAAFGAASARRAVLRAGIVWRAASRRGVPLAAVGTLAVPAGLALMLVQAVTGGRAPRVVARRLEALYARCPGGTEMR